MVKRRRCSLFKLCPPLVNHPLSLAQKPTLCFTVKSKLTRRERNIPKFSLTMMESEPHCSMRTSQTSDPAYMLKSMGQTSRSHPSQSSESSYVEGREYLVVSTVHDHKQDIEPLYVIGAANCIEEGEAPRSVSSSSKSYRVLSHLG